MAYNETGTLSISAVILVVTCLWGTAGHALTVSDPTSYTYYVQQIEQFTEQIDQLTQQIQHLQNIEGLNTEILDSVQGGYDFGQGILKDIQQIQRELNYKVSSTKYQVQRWINVADNPDLEDVTDISEILDEVFRDGRREDETIYKTLDEIYELRQGALRGTITEAEAILEEWEANIKRIEELTSISAATLDLSEALVLTNTILTEILLCLQKMRRFDAQASQSIALLSFKGLDEEIYETHASRERGHFGPKDAETETDDAEWSAKEMAKINLEAE